MSQVLYINILVDWSLSDIMTSKHVTRESESPRPAASSILISRMTRSSVIIPYRNHFLCLAMSCHCCVMLSGHGAEQTHYLSS